MRNGIVRILLSIIVFTGLCLTVVAGCSNGGGDTSAASSSTSEDAAASNASTEDVDQDATTGAIPGGEASSNNMPVPDFSKLMKLNRQEAAEYLAAYPHEGSNEDPVDLVGWAKYYSSEAAEETGFGWNSETGKAYCDPGSWSVQLTYDIDEDPETCDKIEFSMTPLSDSSNEVSTETYAAMIRNYLADSDIHEMTIAVRDLSGREGNYSNSYDGYILFDDLQASVSGSFYSLTILPNPNTNGFQFNWEEVKSRIAEGYYLDKHSGGVTYTYPYIDVYSTASDL